MYEENNEGFQNIALREVKTQAKRGRLAPAPLEH